MRKKIIAANWKMNGRLEDARLLAIGLADALTVLRSGTECVIFPPAIYLALLQSYFTDTPLKSGGQNCHSQEMGAYTGELSAAMFRDLGCRYMLVGHSERRQYFGDNEKNIAEKFHRVKYHDMIPVLCVGETLNERESDQAEAVIRQQILSVIAGNKRSFQNAVIAYEPVWAIGTGKTATTEQAQNMHQFIRSEIALLNDQDAENIPILYGGSVNEKNAAGLFKMPDIDGGLVGGASLNLHQFLEIVKCIN